VDALSEPELLRAIIETQRLVHDEVGDLDGVMQIVAERSRELTGASGAVVELLDDRTLVYRAAAGSVAHRRDTRREMASSFSGKSALEARPLRCDDSETDDRLDRESCRRAGIRSMIVVPLLLADRRCVGVLKVVAPEPYHFGPDAIELLGAMAELISASLPNVQAFVPRDERSLRDPLTGLANRRHLLDCLALALARASHSALPVTVLFVDLDGFRSVNDNLGHAAGDQVLRSVARALAATVRPADTVARLRGDDFVVVCEGVDAAHVEQLAERARSTVACAWHGQLPVTASVAVARSYPDESAEAVLERAEQDMDLTKRARAS
jgi:diguanylate cyclase (GGDEF)-like protein